MHPDRCSHDHDNDGTNKAARFQQLSEAYQVLSTPALRAAYDREGDAVRGVCLFVGGKFELCVCVCVFGKFE